MRKKIYDFESNGIHTFLTGEVLTNSEFMSAPQPIFEEKNKELCNAAARTFDPNFIKMERQQRKFERTEQRRKELAEQQAKINEELARL